jgi:hypothetical protein
MSRAVEGREDYKVQVFQGLVCTNLDNPANGLFLFDELLGGPSMMQTSKVKSRLSTFTHSLDTDLPLAMKPTFQFSAKHYAIAQHLRFIGSQEFLF